MKAGKFYALGGKIRHRLVQQCCHRWKVREFVTMEISQRFIIFRVRDVERLISQKMILEHRLMSSRISCGAISDSIRDIAISHLSRRAARFVYIILVFSFAYFSLLSYILWLIPLSESISRISIASLNLMLFSSAKVCISSRMAFNLLSVVSRNFFFMDKTPLLKKWLYQ